MSFNHFDIYKLHSNLMKEAPEYARFWSSIFYTYEEEYYELNGGNIEISIYLNEAKAQEIIFKYFAHLFNQYIDAGKGAIVSNYGEVFSFDFTPETAREIKGETLKDLINYLIDKTNVGDLINLLNNNAVTIKYYNYNLMLDKEYKSIWDVPGFEADMLDDSIYYEDPSYIIKNNFNFKELDYI